jgi:hypothetical protein
MYKNPRNICNVRVKCPNFVYRKGEIYFKFKKPITKSENKWNIPIPREVKTNLKHSTSMYINGINFQINIIPEELDSGMFVALEYEDNDYLVNNKNLKTICAKEIEIALAGIPDDVVDKFYDEENDDDYSEFDNKVKEYDDYTESSTEKSSDNISINDEEFNADDKYNPKNNF